MATTTDTFATTVELTMFERPPTLSQSPAGLVTPFGELLATTALGVIPAVGAADTNIVTINTTLPDGWFYRLLEYQITALGPAESDLAESQSFMFGVLTENQVSTKRFLLSNMATQYLTADTVPTFDTQAGFFAANPATTNDFQTLFGIDSRFQKGLRDDFIDAAKGTSQCVVTWVNKQANATAETAFTLYSRFLMYSIEQVRHGALWIPTL